MTLSLLVAAASGRGLLTYWVLFLFGLAGTLFPNLLARDFLDEPGVVRWLAVPLLFGSALILSDYYFRWSKGLI